MIFTWPSFCILQCACSCPHQDPYFVCLQRWNQTAAHRYWLTNLNSFPQRTHPSWRGTLCAASAASWTIPLASWWDEPSEFNVETTRSRISEVSFMCMTPVLNKSYLLNGSGLLSFVISRLSIFTRAQWLSEGKNLRRDRRETDSGSGSYLNINIVDTLVKVQKKNNSLKYEIMKKSLLINQCIIYLIPII